MQVILRDPKEYYCHSNRQGNYDIFEASLEQKNDTITASDVIARIDAAIATL